MSKFEEKEFTNTHLVQAFYIVVIITIVIQKKCWVDKVEIILFVKIEAVQKLGWVLLIEKPTISQMKVQLLICTGTK